MRSHLGTVTCILATWGIASAATAQLQPQPPAPAPAPAPAPYPTYAPAPAPAPTVVVAPAPAPAPEPEPEPAAVTGGDDENWGTPSDHDRVVRRVAIGWMGVIGVPIGGPMGSEVVDAPTIGVRYWLNDDIAIEGGLGIGFSSSGATAFSPTGDANLGGVGQFGMVLHGGLPISVMDVGHFNGLIIPEFNLGFSSGIDENGTATFQDDNYIYRGFLLGMGLRIGAEWHMEFLDVPQSSLQVTFGLGLNLAVRGQEDNSGNNGVDSGSFVLKTLGPADLLAGGIQLFFYF